MGNKRPKDRRPKKEEKVDSIKQEADVIQEKEAQNEIPDVIPDTQSKGAQE